MIKKQLIMDKATELFAKQGFESTSVQQITDHCGISKGAFYLSFKSKDELILAIIDHFLMQFTSDIDHIVRNTNKEELLSQFYYTNFHFLQQHSNLAKILVQEQSLSLNKELFLKVHYYDQLLENSILSMIDILYDQDFHRLKYDLMYCIKGFINTYSHLFLFYHVQFDLPLLTQTLVEKTNILANHTTVPFVTEELIHMIRQPIEEEATREQLIEMLTGLIDEMEASIEKDSLLLLKEHVLEPTYSLAIVKGLLENIRKHPHCKWISYLLLRYFKL